MNGAIVARSYNYSWFTYGTVVFRIVLFETGVVVKKSIETLHLVAILCLTSLAGLARLRMRAGAPARKSGRIVKVYNLCSTINAKLTEPLQNLRKKKEIYK